MDRDYMRRRPSLEEPSFRGRSSWQRYLWIAAFVIGLASAGFYLYRNIRAELVPGEGELIVNVNTATETQLRTLPGVDKVIAGRIVAQRPFKRVNDLLRVDGIGPKVLEKIRPYVKVDGETEPS